jgi:hypothetical protein
MTKVRLSNPQEHDRCEYCGFLPRTKREAELHEAGLDHKRLECPHQDVDAIKLREKNIKARGMDIGKVAW